MQSNAAKHGKLSKVRYAERHGSENVSELQQLVAEADDGECVHDVDA